MDAEVLATETACSHVARGDYAAALPHFHAALKRSPSSVTALVNLSRAYVLVRDFGRAADYAQKLTDALPHDAGAWHAAGETYRLIGDYKQAIECLKLSCAAAALPQRRVELASLLERQHHLEEAAEQARLALAVERDLVSALLVLGRVQRRMGDFPAADASLRRAIALADSEPTLAAEAWAELALVLDSSGDFGGAWDAIGRGKQLQLARDAEERRVAEHVLTRFARLVDQTTPEHFRRWQVGGDRSAPMQTALLTGFPRTGTTLLEQVLDSHPGLVSSEEKTVLSMEIFPAIAAGRPDDAPITPILDGMSQSEIAHFRDDYRRKMEGMLREPIGGRIHLDKNPTLSLFLPVLLRLFPATKTIIAIRDPRDVVLSCYLRYLPLNPVSVSFLTPERTAKRYALDMLGWLKYREQIVSPWLEVRYENAVADLPGVARKTLEFLGLPWDDAVLGYRDRARTKTVLSPTYESVSKPVHSMAIGRWRNYEKQLGPVLEELEPYVSEFGYAQ